MTAPNPGIRDYDYSTWSLEDKLAWIAAGAGSGGGDAPKGAMLNLGDSFTLADTNLRQALKGVGLEWEGSAAEKAGTAMTRAAQHSADISTAHSTGSSSLGEYGQSFDGMKASIGRMRPPEYGFWAQAGDNTLGLFGWQSDHKVWEEQKAQLNADADRVLKSHEVAARTALSQFPELAPAAPTTTDSATTDPGTGRGSSKVAVHDPSASPTVAGGPPGRQAGGGPLGADGAANGGAGGSAASTVPPVSGPVGADGNPTGSPTGAGTTGIPGLGDARTATAGYTPSTQLPIQQQPIPSWSPGGSPGPSGALPYGSVPFGGTGAGSIGGGLGGVPRVSTGPEFAARLPRAGAITAPAPAPAPASVRSPARGTAQAARDPARPGPHPAAVGAGTGMGGMPMMGGGGAGGGGDSTRRPKYVIPSSAAFEPPLPPHVDGVLGPEDDEEHPWV